ncbi:MAG TPA: tyrosine-type recombinase/integrase [Burkholderiales bacterium]|jgi:integrase
MAENKLTDKSLRALKPSSVEQLIGDGGGLWVRVLPAAKGGAVNFYYRFQLSGKERRFNCGTYPDTSLSAARLRRNEARQLVDAGIDPVAKEAADRAQNIADQARAQLEKSVNDLFDDWEKVYLSAHRKDKGEFVRSVYEHDIGLVLGKMKAKDVKLAHVIQVIDRLLERGVRRKANMVLSNMRQMFRHGLARGMVETDPTFGIGKKQAGGKEVPVDRNLSFPEIDEFAAAMGKSGLHPRIQAGLWLNLATGARVGELLHAEWSHVDLEKGLWKIPAENAKNGRAHLIHLSPFAQKQFAVLEALKSGKYVFSGRKDGTSLSDKTLSKAVRDRIRATPLKKRTPKSGTLMLSGGEWSPHDLRRTMASRMGDLGVPPHIIERCLNHVQQGIAGVYQRQEYLSERKQAFDVWGAELEKILTPSNGEQQEVQDANA